MARKLKPYEVETIKHDRAGIEVVIYLDRESKDFFADFSGERFSGDTAAKVKMSVCSAIVDSLNWEWKPAIKVYKPIHHGQNDTNASLSINIERFYWARRNDGKNLTSSWSMPNFIRDRNTMASVFHWDDRCVEFNLPCTNSHIRSKDFYGKTHDLLLEKPTEPDTFYIPYSEDLWTGLNQIIQALHTLDNRLKEMIGSDEGIKTLQMVGQQLIGLMLPPPEIVQVKE